MRKKRNMTEFYWHAGVGRTELEEYSVAGSHLDKDFVLLTGYF